MKGIKPIYRAKIIAEVKNGKGHRANDLAGLVHCARRTASFVLQTMHADGLVYISSYIRHTPMGRSTVYFRMGPGTDAKKPKTMTVSERVRKSRRLRSPEAKDFQQARTNQLRRKIKIDPLTAAFFGVKKG